MGGHHLVLGQIKDLITGEILPETHDEQYRQKIARMLVEERGYQKTEIFPRIKKKIRIDDKTAVIQVDFVVRVNDRSMMLIKYGPGSLVSRHRIGLAASRVMEPYQIPVVVVTNGEDADILEGKTGRVTASGLHQLPDKSELISYLMDHSPDQISSRQVEMESRILYAFEIDGKCPCDDTHVQCNTPS